MSSDPDELLDNLRHGSSRLLDGIRRGQGVSQVDVERVAKWFIELDMTILEGRAPVGWSGAKLSKSDQS